MKTNIKDFKTWSKINENNEAQEDKELTDFVNNTLSDNGTFVLCIDSSASLTRDTFDSVINAMWGAVPNIKETIIIYASDELDQVVRYDGREKPTINIPTTSTGGNATGFSPPFKWLEENDIIPSALIYFTDGYAKYPSTNDYGIRKYDENVLWNIFRTPNASNSEIPFGKTLYTDIIL